MKNRAAETILSASAGLIVMLAAAGALLLTTLQVSELKNPFAHAIFTVAELPFGVVLLVGSVLFATRFTVWLAGKSIDS